MRKEREEEEGTEPEGYITEVESSRAIHIQPTHLTGISIQNHKHNQGVSHSYTAKQIRKY